MIDRLSKCAGAMHLSGCGSWFNRETAGGVVALPAQCLSERVVTKRKKSKRGGSKKKRPGGRGASPSTLSSTTTGPLDDDVWAKLRQGARNAAGVRYQVALTAWLLVQSHRGELPFVELTPEGREDIDCQTSDGVPWLVQAKELGAGAGRFTVGKLAEVIAHAAKHAQPHARIVAVTDGQLGRGLADTSWANTLATTEDIDLDELHSALARHGYPSPEAADLLARTSLIRLPWNLQIPTAQMLAAHLDLQPALASLILARFLDDASRLTADQRSTTQDAPKSFRLADLDVLVADVQNVVDLDGLDAAIRAGVCVPADFSADPGLSVRKFLDGVNAVPAHIGAGYDVLRPIAGAAIQGALNDGRYALITGPSGAGKSTQLWRSARDYHPGARVVRVLRLAGDADVQSLVRHVRILEPRENSPVVVVCDDLGRPHTGGWALSARRLLEHPHVCLLGAARREDFSAALLRGGRLVEMHLDDATASLIANQLAAAGVELRMLPGEAVARAEGKMMEFIALLTTGRRLEEVLAEQAERLFDGTTDGAAEVARVICAADTLGVAIDAERLPEAVELSGPALTRALRRLQDEHVVTSDSKDSWRGLHQLRSDVLTRLLHETPPPTLWTTLKHAMRVQGSSSLWWALRRVIELYPVPVDKLASIVREHSVRAWTPAELIEWLEGLARVDHALAARDYLPIIERNLPPHLPLMHFVFVVLANKIAGVDLGGSGDSDSGWDRMGREVRRIARELPNPTVRLTHTAVEVISQDEVIGFIVNAELIDAVRILEASAPALDLTSDQATQIADRFPWTSGLLPARERYLHARLIHGVYRALNRPQAISSVLGPLAVRLEQAAAANPDVLGIHRSGASPDEVILDLLHRPDEQLVERYEEWDVRPPGEDEPINQRAVDLAEYIGWCCPEVETVTVITRGDDGQEFRVGDFKPGHKRLSRSARPDRWIKGLNVGIRVAISRRASGYAWTGLIRGRARIATSLLELMKAAPRRLAPRDNAKRREEWKARLSNLSAQLGDLPQPPVNRVFSRFSASEEQEVSRDTPLLIGPLRTVVQALPRLIETQEIPVYVQVAAQLQHAQMQLSEALGGRTALLGEGEAEVFRVMGCQLMTLRRLLVAIAYRPARRQQIVGPPKAWPRIIQRIIADVDREQMEDEETRLATFRTLPSVSIYRVSRSKPLPTSVFGHEWVITVPLAGIDAAVELMLNLAEGGALGFDVRVTLVAKLGESWLPLAIIPSRLSPAGWLPLSHSEIESLARQAAAVVIDGPHTALLRRVEAALETYRWATARLRLRCQDWPKPEDASAKHLVGARAAIVAATQSCDETYISILTDAVDAAEADPLIAVDGQRLGRLVMAAQLDHDRLSSR